MAWGQTFRDRFSAVVRRRPGAPRDDNFPQAVNVTHPSRHTVRFVERLRPRPRRIAEIGVYRGHTSRELARLLPEDGELHLFDFEETVDAVASELRAEGFDRVVTHGNTKKVLDSYNWSLMKVLQGHAGPIYDYVFIDGAHTWHHDALAFLIVDRLLVPGGHVDFDDYHWTLGGSPTLNPRDWPLTGDWYTREQIETPQVELVVDLLVRRDPRYEEVVENRIFRKRDRG